MVKLSPPSSDNSVLLVVGHESKLFPKATADGHTHWWRIFVRLANGSDRTLIEKVTFHLHPSFKHPVRKVKRAPFEVSASGYAGFPVPISIRFRDDPHVYRIEYDFNLTMAEWGYFEEKKTVHREGVIAQPAKETVEKKATKRSSTSNETTTVQPKKIRPSPPNGKTQHTSGSQTTARSPPNMLFPILPKKPSPPSTVSTGTATKSSPKLTIFLNSHPSPPTRTNGNPPSKASGSSGTPPTSKEVSTRSEPKVPKKRKSDPSRTKAKDAKKTSGTPGTTVTSSVTSAPKKPVSDAPSWPIPMTPRCDGFDTPTPSLEVSMASLRKRIERLSDPDIVYRVANLLIESDSILEAESTKDSSPFLSFDLAKAKPVTLEKLSLLLAAH